MRAIIIPGAIRHRTSAARGAYFLIALRRGDPLVSPLRSFIAFVGAALTRCVLNSVYKKDFPHGK